MKDPMLGVVKISLAFQRPAMTATYLVNQGRGTICVSNTIICTLRRSVEVDIEYSKAHLVGILKHRKPERTGKQWHSLTMSPIVLR